MLRLHIAEKWEPQDYLATFSAIESIYYITVFCNTEYRLIPSSFGQGRPSFRGYRLNEDVGVALVEDARIVADKNQRLVVEAVRHASPGFIDFKGLGEVAEAIDHSFGRIIKIFTERRLRRELDSRAQVETDLQRQNLNTIKIENARRLLTLYADYPAARQTPALERTLVEQQTKIESLIARGLITDQRDHVEDM